MGKQSKNKNKIKNKSTTSTSTSTPTTSSSSSTSLPFVEKPIHALVHVRTTIPVDVNTVGVVLKYIENEKETAYVLRFITENDHEMSPPVAGDCVERIIEFSDDNDDDNEEEHLATSDADKATFKV